jgi:ABC-2 type transport system ATP-binding protein
MPHATGPVAQFEQVWKDYPSGVLRRRSIPAIRGISLSIPAGSIFGLVGPNRAGKTTLIKLLLSLTYPTRGEILRLGRPVADRTTLCQVGYVHDSQAFATYLSARTILRYYGALSGMTKNDLGTLVEQCLDEVGLVDRADQPIAGFSKGMLQRLALAQAILNDPELLVLDEPTEGMDLLARRLLGAVLLRRRQAGRTSIVVSHSLSDIERLCDQVAVLRFGELAFAGRVEELMRNDGGGSFEETLATLYESSCT